MGRFGTGHSIHSGYYVHLIDHSSNFSRRILGFKKKIKFDLDRRTFSDMQSVKYRKLFLVLQNDLSAVNAESMKIDPPWYSIRAIARYWNSQVDFFLLYSRTQLKTKAALDESNIEACCKQYTVNSYCIHSESHGHNIGFTESVAWVFLWWALLFLLSLSLFSSLDTMCVCVLDHTQKSILARYNLLQHFSMAIWSSHHYKAVFDFELKKAA